MRYVRVLANEGYTVDARVIIDACLAVRALGRIHPKIDATSFAGEVADAYVRWFAYFLQAVVLHIERAQRIVDRFKRWRASKMTHPPILGKPNEIGSPYRPIRRFRDSDMDVNAVIATMLAVRALDRADGKSRELAEFQKTLSDAYYGATYGLLFALLALAERDRRFARRFRSWRRSKAARAVSSPSASSSSRSRRTRSTVH